MITVEMQNLVESRKFCQEEIDVSLGNHSLISLHSVNKKIDGLRLNFHQIPKLFLLCSGSNDVQMSYHFLLEKLQVLVVGRVASMRHVAVKSLISKSNA